MKVVIVGLQLVVALGLDCADYVLTLLVDIVC